MEDKVNVIVFDEEGNEKVEEITVDELIFEINPEEVSEGFSEEEA